MKVKDLENSITAGNFNRNRAVYIYVHTEKKHIPPTRCHVMNLKTAQEHADETDSIQKLVTIPFSQILFAVQKRNNEYRFVLPYGRSERVPQYELSVYQDKILCVNDYLRDTREIINIRNTKYAERVEEFKKKYTNQTQKLVDTVKKLSRIN